MKSTTSPTCLPSVWRPRSGVIPYYIAYDYWHAVAEGIDRAAQELAPYNVTVNYIHYLHADEDSYRQACTQVLGEECDAVLLAPNFREETLKLTLRPHWSGKARPMPSSTSTSNRRTPCATSDRTRA